MVETIGLIAAIAMPFFNIPLIYRIVKRRSSGDISIVWVTGVWICVMGMLPSSLQSMDVVLKGFGIANAILFSAVFVIVLIYRKK